MKLGAITLEKVKIAIRESKHIDFKEGFDISQAGDWCEIIKDVVAMANSGGGGILIGIRKDGTPSGWDATQVLNLDPAQLTDKIARYTGSQFADFDTHEVIKAGHQLAVLLIHGVSIPMVFTQPGTYDIGGGKQKTSFGRGTIYFRHGAKSEPANPSDLRECIDREVTRHRKSWLGNIRKVIEAPSGYRINILPPTVIESFLPSVPSIRIVDDSSAPTYQKINRDDTHPHRRKEIIPLINQRLSGRKRITSHDFDCVRKVYKIDITKPEFCYQPKFGSPQYSYNLVDWLIEQYEKNSKFFEKTRGKYRKITKIYT